MSERTDASDENDTSETGIGDRTDRLSVCIFGLITPFQFVVAYQSYSSEPLEAVLGGFTVGLLAIVYWFNTRAGTVRHDGGLLRALTHPVVRGIYLVLGVIGVVIAIAAGVKHPTTLLVTATMFTLLIGVFYWQFSFSNSFTLARE